MRRSRVDVEAWNSGALEVRCTRVASNWYGAPELWRFDADVASKEVWRSGAREAGRGPGDVEV